MNRYAFCALSPVMQLYWVIHHGTFLANCWEQEGGSVNLYHCAGNGRSFFVEVGIDNGKGQAVMLVKACGGGMFQGCYRVFRIK